MTATSTPVATKKRRRSPARINAVIRGRAVAMSGVEHQFKRFHRQYPRVADAFADATIALAKLTNGAPPTAVGALGIARVVVKSKGTLPRVRRNATSVTPVTPGLPNQLAPYYARLFNARHAHQTGIKYDTRKA
jgi:hypothetical protein